jgi:uncharacterized zinc-type alcohol dehydrogenase-like protein
MLKSSGYAAAELGSTLAPFNFTRRAPDAQDITLEILFSGVCHSDLSMVNNEWGYSQFPLVPGHEIIGRVTAVGAEVKKFKIGDIAGIGTVVDSCRTCTNCNNDLEQFCLHYCTQTYGSRDRKCESVMTYGGYSDNYVVDQRFAHKIPEGMDPAAAAPLLCAGITTYSPLRHWKVGPGQTVGIVGLGGLGHVAVKFAHAMGARVVVFTTSPGKEADAKRLGADEVALSTDPAQMQAYTGTLDFILDTVAAQHDLNLYMSLLKTDGTMCLVGMPGEALPLLAYSVVFGRKNLSGSGVGGMAETQEMLDFAGAHGIGAEIELIKMQDINTAFERLRRNDVKYRFVIDMKA